MRVKLIGTRAEVGGMYAIASIKEDYLGLVALFLALGLASEHLLTSFKDAYKEAHELLDSPAMSQQEKYYVPSKL